MSAQRPVPRAVRGLFLVALAVLSANQAHAILWPPQHQALIWKLIYDVCLLLVSGLALARGRWRQERTPWLLVASGITLWSSGDIFFTLRYWDDADVPFPSWADAGYLLLSPLTIAGLVGLYRLPLRERPRALVADGFAAAFSIGSVGAALVVSPVVASAAGSKLDVVLTNAAYPITDLLLFAVVVGGLAGTGWQLQRRAVLLVSGVVSFYAADSLYLLKTAQGTYSSPSWIDTGWWLGVLLLALAAWQPPPRRPQPADDERLRLVVMPLAFALISLIVLVQSVAVANPSWASVLLAASSLLAVMVRLMLTFGQNISMLRRSRTEAATDPLTGMGNRRRLDRELHHRVTGTPIAAFRLVLFDLDGFKHYNDSFGHPAGDALLRRLGDQLDRYVTDPDVGGQAFRMGGDEFCALVPDRPDVVAGAVAALHEDGDGFTIGASHGAVLIPDETASPIEAMRVADQRLFADKHSRRSATGRHTADVLMITLAEHSPGLSERGLAAARLAVATAQHLGMDTDEMQRVRLTAELHAIGKVGIPATILESAGPLSDDEWTWLRRCPSIGERILSASPSLLPIAGNVRSTREHWDGSGYPDALAGTQIPLVARIVAVADAFVAMTTARPHCPARPVEAALEELSRCSGTQFDPHVVQTFVAAALGQDGQDAGDVRASIDRSHLIITPVDS